MNTTKREIESVRVFKLSPDVRVIRTRHKGKRRIYIYIGNYKVAKVEVIEK